MILSNPRAGSGARLGRRGEDVYGQACDFDHSLLYLCRRDLLVCALYSQADSVRSDCNRDGLQTHDANLGTPALGADLKGQRRSNSEGSSWHWRDILQE
jgi:hypothetical protein